MYNLKKSGKKLAFLLRHDREYAFDAHGWRSVRDLVTEHGFTVGQLRHIVAVDDKQRYEFDESGKYMRARQGHTVQVDVEPDRLTPPASRSLVSWDYPTECGSYCHGGYS